MTFSPLTAAERQSFIRDGVLLRREFITGPRLQRANDLINDWSREGFGPRT